MKHSIHTHLVGVNRLVFGMGKYTESITTTENNIAGAKKLFVKNCSIASVIGSPKINKIAERANPMTKSSTECMPR